MGFGLLERTLPDRILIMFMRRRDERGRRGGGFRLEPRFLMTFGANKKLELGVMNC